MPICRSLFRGALFAGLGLGAITLLVGPQRVGAAFDQVRAWGQNAVDTMVEDPVALRRQLEQLGSEYPARIGQLRGEIAQTDRQLRQLEQECEVSRRVVAMTTADLDQIQAALADQAPATGGVQAVAVRIRGERFDESSARAEVRRIQTIRGSHQDRLGAGERQVALLREQRTRLGAIMAKLEREHADFEVKLAALDRQIDAVGRNKRLIAMAKEQASVLEEYEKTGRVGNLGQLEGRLEQIRLEQEAQLETLLNAPQGDPYEAAAKDAIRAGEPSAELPPRTSAPSVPSAPARLPVAPRGGGAGIVAATSR